MGAEQLRPGLHVAPDRTAASRTSAARRAPTSTRPRPGTSSTPAISRLRTIGVIDTGVAYEHPDLAANMVPGKDFYDADNDPRDIHGHGTHVASVAAGVADNAIGTAGVNPWAKVMPLRAADEYGSFSWAAIEQAVAYGLAHGVRVFNGSFGGPDDDPAFEELIAEQPAGAVRLLRRQRRRRPGRRQPRRRQRPRPPLPLRHRSAQRDLRRSEQLERRDVAASRTTAWTRSTCLRRARASTRPSRAPCRRPTSTTRPSVPYDAVDETAPIGLGGGPFAFQLLSRHLDGGAGRRRRRVAALVEVPDADSPRRSRARSSRTVDAARVRPDQGRLRRPPRRGRRGQRDRRMSGAVRRHRLADPARAADRTRAGDGGSTGGTGPTTAAGDRRHPDRAAAQRLEPLTFQIIRPRVARVGSANKVKFKLKCSDICSAAAWSDAALCGVDLQALQGQARPRQGRHPHDVGEDAARDAACDARAARRGARKVRLKFSVIVTDKAGPSSKPVAFSSTLAK